MLSLRATQPLFVEKAVESLQSKSQKKTVHVAPVAYGKSICIANIVLKLDGGVLVLQPNQELLRQNYSKYVSYGNEASIYCVSMKSKQMNKQPYALIDGEYIRCNEISNVTYATVGSIVKDADKLKSFGIKYIVVDECHLQSSVDSRMRELIAVSKIKNVIGVTATPVVLRSSIEGAVIRMMNKDRKNLFSTISHVVQIQEVVEAGHWAKLKYIVRDSDLSALEFNTNGSDYTLQSMRRMYSENNMDTRAVSAIKYMQDVQDRKSIIIFTPSIADSLDLQKKIPNSAVVSSKTPTEERLRIVTDFKNMKIPVVINTDILTTGFDHPQLDGILMLRPTASIALYYQKLGRATRIHEDKDYSLIVDLCGNVDRFGKIEDLNYEFIPGYGWGLFNKDVLLTGFPIKAFNRPTKESIAKSVTVEGILEVKNAGKTKLWFGKHKDKPIEAIPKPYLTFMLDEFEFNSDRMMNLQKEIKIFLNIE